MSDVPLYQLLWAKTDESRQGNHPSAHLPHD